MINLVRPAIVLCVLLGFVSHGNTQDTGANAQVAGERFGMSAAIQGGRQLAWRVDIQNGRVSICIRLGQETIVCSPWSDPSQSEIGPFAINAEFSQIAGIAWVWRIDTKTGDIAHCQVSVSTRLDKKPVCMEPAD